MRRTHTLSMPRNRDGTTSRVLLLAFLSLFFGTLPVAAQQTGQDTTRTREERIRDRLRNLGPLIRDTARDTLAADTLGADTTAGRPRPGDTTRTRQPQGSLSGVQRDSMMLQMLTLSGYIATEYKGEQARFDADSGKLVLRRTAEVLENGQLLKADSTITYWEPRNLACATGNPEVSGAGTAEPILGDSLCYNTQTRIGFVRGAQTTVSEGANWRIQGDFYFVDETNAGFGHDAIFTDCDLEVPHYHFAAKDMKVLRGNVIVARNVTMKFGDVPVFWLPFFVQGLGRGRQSGILFPGFQMNDIVRTSTGYERRITDVGFYWAVNDYMGAEVAMDWFSNNWTAVRGSFDYRILDKFLQGGATVRRYWRSSGNREFTIASNNSWEMNERTRVSLSANYATSSSFVRQNTFDPREINQNISSNAGINRRFDWGTVNLTASRSQYLSSEQLNQTLPRVGVNIASVTLFEALPGEERWYSNATWTGGFDGEITSRDPGLRRSLRNPAQTEAKGGANSSFTMGNFSISQRADLRETTLDPDSLIVPDTLALHSGQRRVRGLQWSSSLNYQQRLIGTSTLTPSLTVRGEFMEGDTTGGQRIAAPTRIDFGASLRTDMYGFLPGVGPVERLRHKVSPGISYRYSPEPNVTDRQRAFYNIREIREQNAITLMVNQSIEAKVRSREDTAETAQPDSAEARDTTRTTGPRRIERNQPIQVLSLTTSAIAYDFVRAREEGDGFTTSQITNSITSDLLRGLQLSITHDLFEELGSPTTGPDGRVVQPDRRFKPALTSLTASFSLNSDSWLARTLRLGRRRTQDEQASARADSLVADSLATADTLPGGMQAGTGSQRQGDQFGLIGSGRRDMHSARGAIGTWNANFNYSLTKGRGLDAGENQQLTANASFQPTENWSLNWSTGYSFTSGEFTDHVLTLTRSLHDWDANFDFVKAQNGNFSFNFRVALRANQDIKLDYEQRERRRQQGF